MSLLAVLLTGVAGMLVVPSAFGQTQAQDSVSGSGTSVTCPITIDARSGPSGEAPSGQVNCESFFSGPVSCLNVQGNVALLTVEGTAFGTIAMRITDNGVDTFDSVEAIPGSGCAQPQAGYANFLFFEGDIVVRDAQPQPTSKDQCKNGGWKTYGVFKNQGDCVSFVATGGTNPPSK
jgi:hypothetical protein